MDDRLEVLAKCIEGRGLWVICRDCGEAWPYEERDERSCECEEDHDFLAYEIRTSDWDFSNQD